MKELKQRHKKDKITVNKLEQEITKLKEFETTNSEEDGVIKIVSELYILTYIVTYLT